MMLVGECLKMRMMNLINFGIFCKRSVILNKFLKLFVVLVVLVFKLGIISIIMICRELGCNICEI